MALLLATASSAHAQIASEPVTSDYAVRRSAYPRILPGSRAEFKISAPDARKVQIDLDKKYDMERQPDGSWTCVTDSLGPGFHYYFIIVLLSTAHVFPIRQARHFLVAVSPQVVLRFLIPKGM